MRLLMATALVAVGVVLGAPPASAAPTVTVTPTTNLVSGQAVSVTGSQWPASTHLGVIECGYFTAIRCLPQLDITTDAAGSFSTQYIVQRFILGNDCVASPPPGCIVAVAEMSASPDLVATPVAFSTQPQPPLILPTSGQRLEGNSGTTGLPLTVSLEHPSTETVTVQWNTLPPEPPVCTAIPGTDYIPAAGTVTFAPGVTKQTITIMVIGDTVIEPDECFAVSFHDPVNGIVKSPGVAFGTILNDDHVAVPKIVPNGGAVTKPTHGTATLPIAVSLTVPTTVTVTAQWNTLFLTEASDVQATPGTDYTAATGTITFAPGQTTQTVPIQVNSGILADPYKIFVVSFHHPTNATMGGYWGLAFGFILGNTGQAQRTTLNPATLPEVAIAALTQHRSHDAR